MSGRLGRGWCNTHVVERGLPPRAPSPAFASDCLVPLQLEWGRGRVFDGEVGAVFQRLVHEAKQVGHVCV